MKKKIWIIDLLALSGFLLTFLPQITGYDLHEWLGLAVGATLIVHLIQHWRWVVSISKNLQKSKARLLIRYFLDGLLALGLTGIVLTGLVISSILNLSLVNYEAWYVVHFSISYISLVLLLLKITLHWKQINNMIACLFKHERCEPELTPAQVSRRLFLRDAGFASIGLFVAGSGINSLLRNVAEVSASNIVQVPTQAATATQAPGPTAFSATLQTGSPQETVTAPRATDTLAPSATPTATTASGKALCNLHCAYPGKCRKYVDNNGNGYCDRGEFIW